MDRLSDSDTNIIIRSGDHMCLKYSQQQVLTKILFFNLLQLASKCVGFVSAGFPSPAEEYSEKKLDLNDLLVKKPSATFFVKAAGNAMHQDGILDHDLLIVDRSLKAVPGCVVIASLDGQLNVCKLIKINERYYLKTQTFCIDITENDNVTIWGVVRHAVHHFLSML
jgi:DNA polymerase V